MKRLGVVHIISPEQAVSSPSMRLVCGDSQTSTAFGMLAHGIGTSEVEHMLGTQTLLARKSENMLLRVEEELAVGCSAKDIVLATIDRMGPAGGTASWRRSAHSYMGLFRRFIALPPSFAPTPRPHVTSF
jgi:3-isopropylmalate/(R)-2-methylmalate dehydratase large subunit